MSSEEKLSDALRGLASGIIWFDTEKRVVGINPSAERMLRLSGPTVIGMRCSELPTPKGTRDWLADCIDGAFKSGRTVNSYIMAGSFGGTRWRGLFVPDVGPDGSVQKVFLVISEVWAEELGNNGLPGGPFRSPLWSTPGVHLVLSGHELRITFANAKARSIFSAKSIVGQTLDDLNVSVDDELRQLFEVVRHGREPITRVGRSTSLSPSRAAKFYRLMIVPMPLDAGAVDLSVVVADATLDEERRFARFAEGMHEERARLRSIIDTLPIGMEIIDSTTGDWEANSNAARIWGLKGPKEMPRDRSAYVGHRLETGRKVDERDWPLIRALERGESALSEEFEIERFDGTVGFVLISGAPMRNSAGAIIGAVSAFVDMTEKKEMERQLEKQTTELERSNADLRQFAYVASHDLQEPLRTVTNYVARIERKLQSSLDAQTKEYMQFVVEGARRMRMLIDDLLAYSSVDSHPAAFGTVDMNAVVGQVVSNLEVAIRDSNASVKVSKLPNVQGDAVQLVLLFQNLLSNALKFHGGQPLMIEVYAERDGGDWRFAVHDNGIGIDPKYHRKIFEMFQRLNSPEKYPGTGIGLTISKKIVERHSGRIWVESEVAKGATFYFSLPAVDEDPIAAGRQ